MGIVLKPNIRFGRVELSIPESSCLSTLIPTIFHTDHLLIAIECGTKVVCQPSRVEVNMDVLNNLRMSSSSGSSNTVSFILRKAGANSHQEATLQLKKNLKTPNFCNASKKEQEDILQAKSLCHDHLDYVYEHQDKPENRRFFANVESLLPFDAARKDAEDGGTYIGQKQPHLPLKYGSSQTNCMNRKKRQNLLMAWLFCSKEEAVDIVPKYLLDKLMSLKHLPCVQFDPSKDSERMMYLAIIIVEATLSSIYPTITGTVGDPFATPSEHVLAIADPYISEEVMNKIVNEGFVGSGDDVHLVGSWPKLSDDAEKLRHDEKYALLDHHLRENPKDCLKFFLYKAFLESKFNGYTTVLLCPHG